MCTDAPTQLLIMLSESGSTAMPDTSVFQRLLLSKGTNPPRLALFPATMLAQALFPVEPVPPPPGFPPLLPPLFVLPLLEPEPLQEISSPKTRNRHNPGTSLRAPLRFLMPLFFRRDPARKREPPLPVPPKAVHDRP